MGRRKRSKEGRKILKIKIGKRYNFFGIHRHIEFWVNLSKYCKFLHESSHPRSPGLCSDFEEKIVM